MNQLRGLLSFAGKSAKISGKLGNRYVFSSSAINLPFSSRAEMQPESLEFLEQPVFDDCEFSKGTFQRPELSFEGKGPSVDVNVLQFDADSPEAQGEEPHALAHSASIGIEAQREDKRLTLSQAFESFLRTQANSASADDWSDYFHKFTRLNHFQQSSKVLVEMKKAGLKPDANLYLTFLMTSLDALMVDEVAHIYLKPSEYFNRPHRTTFVECVKTIYNLYKEENSCVDAKLYYRIASMFYRFKSIRYYRLLLEFLENNRIPVPISIFNMLMSLLAEYPNSFHNVKMIYIARKTTDEVDLRSTYWLLYATIKAKEFDELKSFMADLHSKNEAKHHHYEMIIQLLLKNGFLQEAVSTYNDLKLLKGFEPTKQIYCSFLMYYGFKVKNQKELMNIFSEFTEAHPNVEGNSDVFALYFKAATSLAPQKVSEFLNVLIDKKVPLTIEIYSSVLNFLLSNSISYETRSFLSSLFNSWAKIDDTKSSYEIHPSLHGISSSLPISVNSILGHMHANQINAFNVDVLASIIRHFYSSQCWEDIIKIWALVDKTQIFSKPSSIYIVMLAAIHTKNVRLTLSLVNFICKRRILLLENFSERLLEALSNFDRISRDHPIFKILKGSILRKQSSEAQRDAYSSRSTTRRNTRRSEGSLESREFRDSGSQSTNSNQHSSSSATRSRYSDNDRSEAPFRRRFESNGTPRHQQGIKSLEDDKIFSSFSNDPLF
ncbi:hypothetical protein MDAP_001411 [Mitosporidium daphniae]|uniref:Uncharacterized protein n=1 Tax=Mitosporidium daphniae TaxID=1485682 RepID=A0A098VVS8_9MICR|nr:uncharacterized protein DI09_102p70 [Mitosporidium daphniae]KGG53223.1 hypothetical protein DI09_102p70 [Mitosporidium daphniae]|eukprot:XP_013239659.1 uncharacterized protein DI09_102p70 [Mitosporidium daphniae]